MKKAFVALLLATAGTPVLATPATAGIAQYAEQQPDSPILVTGCFAGVQFTSNRWGTTSSFLNTGVDFKNTSSKTAVAVLFRMQLSNAFGDVIDNLSAQATGQFAPDASIKGNRWSNTDTYPGLGIIQCSVNRVLFSDGSVWNETRVVASPRPLQATPTSAAPP